MKNETPKVATPITASDVLAVVAKSEVIPSTAVRPEPSNTPKSEILPLTTFPRHHSMTLPATEKMW